MLNLPSDSQLNSNQSLFGMLAHGGYTMLPLIACSILGVYVIIERSRFYRKLSLSNERFHLEIMNALLRKDVSSLEGLLKREPLMPTAQILRTALDRINSKDEELKKYWRDAVERRRALVNQDLRNRLWVLGTVASAAPFIGLAGTVVGILGAFGEMARKGAGGFTVVAAGISEALIATAAGIFVAVVAVLAFNTFQAYVTKLVLQVKIQTDEMCELLASFVRSEENS